MEGISVRNKLFGGFARFQPPLGGPRPEWPRLSSLGVSAKRLAQRFVSGAWPFRLKCTIAPGILTGKGAGLPLLLLLFTLASRPLLRSPGPGLSFRGIAQWSRTRAVTCMTAASRCSSWNSHPRHCITLAYFLLYYHPVVRHPQRMICSNHWVLASVTILVLVHFVMKRPPRTQRAVAHGVEHALVPRPRATCTESAAPLSSCSRP